MTHNLPPVDYMSQGRTVVRAGRRPMSLGSLYALQGDARAPEVLGQHCYVVIGVQEFQARGGHCHLLSAGETSPVPRRRMCGALTSYLWRRFTALERPLSGTLQRRYWRGLYSYHKHRLSPTFALLVIVGCSGMTKFDILAKGLVSTVPDRNTRRVDRKNFMFAVKRACSLNRALPFVGMRSACLLRNAPWADHVPSIRGRGLNCGGGLRRPLPYLFVATFEIVSGTLDGLCDGDVLHVLRRARAEDDVPAGLSTVLARILLRYIYQYLPRAVLEAAARAHHIALGRNRSVTLLDRLIETHQCGVDCAVDAWILKRPLFSAQNPFRIFSSPITMPAQTIAVAADPPNTGKMQRIRFLDPVVAPVNAPVPFKVGADTQRSAGRRKGLERGKMRFVSPILGEEATAELDGASEQFRKGRADYSTFSDRDGGHGADGVSTTPKDVVDVDDLLHDEPFPPRKPSISLLADIARGWVEDCQESVLAEAPCAVCAQLVLEVEREVMDLQHESFDILREHEQDVVSWRCGVANERTILCQSAVDSTKNIAYVCKKCYNALYKQFVMPRCALANGLWLGPVPEELSELTMIEKCMVARYRHNVCVVTLDNGARKLAANAVVFSQPVAKFCRVLPPSRDELSEVLIVIFTGSCVPTDEEWKRTPLLISKRRVLRALHWLRDHHPSYNDLVISYENLNSYPESEPPVAWYHRPVSDGVPAASLSVAESSEDRGVDDGPCPFAVHGVCVEQITEMGAKARKLLAAQHLLDKGRLLAYGHASHPESIYHNPELYPGMFPWLYPYGYGGFENSRISVGIARRTHIKWCMNYYDRRFQVDEYFPFLVFNQEQIRACSRGGFVLTERRNYGPSVEKILEVDLDILAELVERGKRDGFVRSENEDEKRCWQLLSVIEHVAGHVAWSGTRRKYQRDDIRSMIIMYGVPIFFITFAPSESKNPLCLFLCGEAIDLTDYLPMQSTDKERLTTVVRNPVACAKFFDLMVRLFLKHVLRVDNDGDGLFGKTQAYYGTVEQQGRTTLHLHLLLWIKGSYSPQEIRDRALDNNSTFAGEILQWLEACHQGEFSTGSQGELEQRLLDKGRPRPKQRPKPWWPNPSTALPEPPPENASESDLEEWMQKVIAITDEILCVTNVHLKEHSKGCLRPPDFICRGRFPRLPLYPYSFVEPETGALRLKKSESWVNTFNILLTYLMRCNTDVTSLLSGTQVRAVIAYVTDYVTKMSLKSHVVFEAIHTVLSNNADIISSTANRTEAARRLVVKVVNALTAQQESGGPMVCADLLGLPDHYTGCNFRVCYWYSYVQRVLDTWAESSEPNSGLHSRDNVQLSSRDGEIVGYCKVDDYILRPNKLRFMCLFDYLRRTDVVKINDSIQRALEKTDDDVDDRPMEGEDSVSSDDESEDIDDHESTTRDHTQRYFRFRTGHPKCNTHVVKLLKPEQFVVPKIVGVMLPRRDGTDREAYCRAMLMFFKRSGWRSGAELKDESESWEDAFDSYDFLERHKRIMKNMNVLYECKDSRDDYAADRRAGIRRGSLPDFLSDDILNDLDQARHDDLILNEMVGSEYVHADQEHEYEGRTTAKHRRDAEMMGDYLQELDAQGRHLFPRNVEAANWLEIAPRSPFLWKDILSSARDELVRSRSEGNHLPQDQSHASRFVFTEGQVRLVTEDQYERYERGEPLEKAIDTESPVHIESIASRFQLNREQRRAFAIVAVHLSRRIRQPLRMYLGGMAGTGKSRVIHALTLFLEERKEGYRFALAAPTGAAACLIGGSTYHTLLSIHPSGHISLRQLSQVRDKISPVDTLFIDEVSMVGCKAMYEISAQLCNAFNLPLDSFAGRNMIFAGDFCQLPPAGGESALYSSRICLQTESTARAPQKNALGRSLWHTFTTVVILRDNMRQIGLSEEDMRFRTALENLRYGRCTSEDITLFRSRVVGLEPGRPHIGMPEFRDQSIVVAWNSHRDAINELSVHRFAAERNLTLHRFYSRDKVKPSSMPESMRQAMLLVQREYSARSTYAAMVHNLQEKLWELPPAATDHVPGVLQLCVGLPVLLKQNEATELGATNGAEAFVESWDAEMMSCGKERLLTVFVRLANPVRDIELPGLPLNVVPVVSCADDITCSMTNDNPLGVTREQVQLLPNFAMTDYSVQGRTRQFNPVDLRNCRGHQSIYTCLSRSSTLQGTLILHDFDERRIVDGASLDLRRELRELEILNDITLRKYEGTLPASVQGSDRSALVASYQGVFGIRHVPNGVHEALQWHFAPAVELRPPVAPTTWKVVQKQKESEDKSKKRRRNKKSTARSGEGKRRKKASTQGRPANGATSSVVHAGLLWDSQNWSCAYDSVLTVLWNTYAELGPWWYTGQRGNDISSMVVDLFARVATGEETLAHVRDLCVTWRHNANRFSALDLDLCLQPSTLW
ncbi:hypothetical protein NM688_g846 [Phlebia brevispora]|uniref:Uncharacterized protein n=1 Tax=Phlebia brevispora TaxID=194682 RepID=A0ACC1TD18_9APHY|nr:hypothetical protein NM688_g846 [Phlebia brevispora]